MAGKVVVQRLTRGLRNIIKPGGPWVGGAMGHARRCATALGFVLATAFSPSNGQDAQALFAEGFDLLAKGDAKQAIVRFEGGLRVEPNNALARFYLGEAYRAVGSLDKARAQWRKSISLDPTGETAGQARRRLAEGGDEDQKGAIDSTGPKPGTVFRDCPTCPEMVVVPAGRFVMGSPRSEAGRDETEGPPRLVTLSAPLAVGRFEVTFAEWDACVADGACPAAKDEGWGRGQRPVINISHPQAKTYATWLAQKTGKPYRLLSEAEWEYAARAGVQGAAWWGEDSSQACRYANVSDRVRKRVFQLSAEAYAFECDDGHGPTAPAGSYQSNAFGLHDMLGNVWEWVEDCQNGSFEGAPDDGSAWAKGNCNRRMTRGGSWYDKPDVVRLAQRRWSVAKERSSAVGFRVARRLP